MLSVYDCTWYLKVRVDVWFFFFFKQKTAYEMRISDWSSDVCSSDLPVHPHPALPPDCGGARGFRGRIYDRRPAELSRRPGEAWHAQRNGDRGQLHREADRKRVV